MVQVLDTYLSQILKITDFNGDPNHFKEQFENNLYTQIFILLLDSIPFDKQQELLNEFTKMQDNTQAGRRFLEQHFTKDQIAEAMREGAREAIRHYLSSIYPTLTDMQKDNLRNLIDAYRAQLSAF